MSDAPLIPSPKPNRYQYPTAKMYEAALDEERNRERARSDAETELRLDLIDFDPSTLTGAERMDRARAIAASVDQRNDALERVGKVESTRDLVWEREAYDFLLRYLDDHYEMFVDDLWDAGLPHAHEDRALGPLFLRAAKAGLMRKTGEYRPSTRSNMTDKPVWRSLIFKPPTAKRGD